MEEQNIRESIQEVAPSSPAEQIKQAGEALANATALERVRQDFDHAEAFRRQNHDHRWSSAEELFLGWVRQKYWEGTKIPRASLSTHLVMEHVESMLPKVLTVLFGESYWFDARPYPSVDVNEARAVQDLMLAQYREVNGATGIREVFRRSCKSALLYGNGILYQGWSRKTIEKPVYQDVLIPVKVPMPINLPTGQQMTIEVPTGKMRREVRETVEQVEINEPVLEYISLKDFYIDPNCSSPLPQDARYVIRRKLPTIKTIKDMASIPGMNVPTDGQLLALAQEKSYSAGDQSKQQAESLRDVSYQPINEYMTGGESQRVELLEYWTEDRLIYVLGRRHILYNGTNPYGYIPFYNISFVDVLDRFYSMGMGDVQESEQRLQQGLINGRLDEVNLALHPPIRKKRGQPIPLSQLRRRPGLVTEADDPEKDIYTEEISNVTQNAYLEVQASEIRSQRRDGINELVVQGVASQGNSANRTAAGVNTQASATMSRIGYFVENVQEMVLVPMIDDLLILNKKFNTPQSVMEILGPEGQLVKLDPAIIRRVEMRFEMRASNKAASRSAMLGVAPWLIQTLMNPELIGEMRMKGITLDEDEVINIALDATGYRSHKSSLFRKLSPQEMQAIQQQQIDQTKIATQQIRGQSQMEITQEKESSNLLQKLMEMMQQKGGENGNGKREDAESSGE